MARPLQRELHHRQLAVARGDSVPLALDLVHPGGPGQRHAGVVALEHALAKLARKGCDLLVVNDVSGGQVFGSPDNEAIVLDAAGEQTAVPRGSKSALAQVVWDRVVARLPSV